EAGGGGEGRQVGAAVTRRPLHRQLYDRLRPPAPAPSGPLRARGPPDLRHRHRPRPHLRLPARGGNAAAGGPGQGGQPGERGGDPGSPGRRPGLRSFLNRALDVDYGVSATTVAISLISNSAWSGSLDLTSTLLLIRPGLAGVVRVTRRGRLAPGFSTILTGGG